MKKITLSFLIFTTFVLAVPLLSLSSFAQGPPVVVTCCLSVNVFCLPEDVDDFLVYMSACREDCVDRIDVTPMLCLPGGEPCLLCPSYCASKSPRCRF